MVGVPGLRRFYAIFICASHDPKSRATRIDEGSIPVVRLRRTTRQPTERGELMADRFDYFIEGPNGPEPIGSHAICGCCMGVKEITAQGVIYCPVCDKVK